jgi:hypothetical protein
MFSRKRAQRRRITALLRDYSVSRDEAWVLGSPLMRGRIAELEAEAMVDDAETAGEAE